MAAYNQYSYFVKYRSHRRNKNEENHSKRMGQFFLLWDFISLKIGKVFYMISFYVSIKGQQRSSWSFLRLYLLNLSNALGELDQKRKCIYICWPSVLDKLKSKRFGFGLSAREWRPSHPEMLAHQKRPACLLDLIANNIWPDIICQLQIRFK